MTATTSLATITTRESRRPAWVCAGAALAGLASLLCSGCVNTSFPVGPQGPVAVPSPTASSPAWASTPRVYLLQSGDAFDVKMFYSPELNESVVVRPDGKISLQLVGEVQAAGNSPSELERDLRERYAKLLREPVVTVVVKQFGPQRVFVAGEVKNPGEVPLQEDMTAFQAVARAGFFTRDSEARNVVVLRYKGGNGPEFILLDMKAMVDGQPGAKGDVLLQPMDVVFVPQTQIAGVADFFNRYVNSIVPLWRNLGFSMIYYTNTARVIGR